MASIVTGRGDREVTGSKFGLGELPVQRWGQRNTLTIVGYLRPAQNLPGKED